jgi:hypothetical protein
LGSKTPNQRGRRSIEGGLRPPSIDPRGRSRPVNARSRRGWSFIATSLRAFRSRSGVDSNQSETNLGRPWVSIESGLRPFETMGLLVADGLRPIRNDPEGRFGSLADRFDRLQSLHGVTRTGAVVLVYEASRASFRRHAMGKAGDGGKVARASTAGRAAWRVHSAHMLETTLLVLTLGSPPGIQPRDVPPDPGEQFCVAPPPAPTLDEVTYFEDRVDGASRNGSEFFRRGGSGRTRRTGDWSGGHSPSSSSSRPWSGPCSISTPLWRLRPSWSCTAWGSVRWRSTSDAKHSSAELWPKAPLQMLSGSIETESVMQPVRDPEAGLE